MVSPLVFPSCCLSHSCIALYGSGRNQEKRRWSGCRTAYIHELHMRYCDVDGGYSVAPVYVVSNSQSVC